MTRHRALVIAGAAVLVVGGSAGAPSAPQMALRHPDRVSALVHLVPLASMRTPTLVVSARDDRCGTYASAQYTAVQIAGATFIGFDEGGHTWVGHDDEVMSQIAQFVMSR